MKTWVKRYFWAVHCVVIGIGLGVVAAGAWVGTNSLVWGSAILSLGVTIAATDGVFVLHWLFGIAGLDMNAADDRRFSAMGLASVHLGKADDQFFRRWARARQLDLLYCSGIRAFKTYNGFLEQSFKKEGGCNLRILIADPNCTFVRDADNADALCPSTNIENDIGQTKLWLDGISTKLHSEGVTTGTISARFYTISPTCSLAIVDNQHAWYTPYLPYKNSADAVSIELDNIESGLFQYDTKMFDEVWHHSETREFARIDFRLPVRSNSSDLD